MHPKSLGDAGTEAVGLNQCTNEGADVVNTGSIHQVAQGFGPWLSGAHFQIDQMEFVAEIGMGVMQVLAHSHEGLVERQAGFHANDCEVERVGQAEANAQLPLLDHSLQNEARQKEAQSGDPGQEGKVCKALEREDNKGSENGAENARAEIVIDVDSVAVSRLDEPATRVRETSAGDSGIALLMGSSACSMRSRMAGLFSACRDCTLPRARRRAPRTDPGLTTAAPKKKTAPATATKMITTINRGDMGFYTWIRIIFRITK